MRHHALTLESSRDPVLGPFVRALRKVGFHIDDFTTNGILLPTLTRDSRASGLPVHVGGHPNYNVQVGNELHALRRVCESFRTDSLRFEFALRGVRALQARIRKALANQGGEHINNVRLCHPTDQSLDALIDRLFRDAAANRLI